MDQENRHCLEYLVPWIKPDEGEVYIDDINIGELNDKQLSKLRREKDRFCISEL